MKDLKGKITITILFVLILSLCAIWAPWQGWDISLPRLAGVEEPEKFARLQVSSFEGEVAITIDGEKFGSVGPEGSPFSIEDIKPGKRTVKLERVVQKPVSYITFERLIDFKPDIDVVIGYELGPTEEFSGGHMITAFNNFSNDKNTKLNVVSTPTNSEVFLDEKFIGRTPVKGISLNIDSVHKLKIKKNGYEEQEISLLPEDEKHREGLAGYDIDVEVNLFLIPIKIE